MSSAVAGCSDLHVVAHLLCALGQGMVLFDEFCIWCAHRHLGATFKDGDEVDVDQSAHYDAAEELKRPKHRALHTAKDKAEERVAHAVEVEAESVLLESLLLAQALEGNEEEEGPVQDPFGELDQQFGGGAPQITEEEVNQILDLG